MRVVTAWSIFVLTIITTACNAVSEPDSPRTVVGPSSLRPSADALPTASLACGAQISSDVRLANDLTCVGNALLVSGDDITIDLNGRALIGNGTGNGITVSASQRVTIFGGSVAGFQSQASSSAVRLTS